MKIIIEADNIKIFYNYPNKENMTNILFHSENYIIFPSSKFNNFHVQFDLNKILISFYSNDTSILEIKIEIIPSLD